MFLLRNKDKHLLQYSTYKPSIALHWQCSALLAALVGSDTAPHPQCMHGAFTAPGAKKPLAHGTQGSCKLCAAATPWPGTHVQFAMLVASVVEVFLCVGHAVHGMLLRSSEKRP